MFRNFSFAIVAAALAATSLAAQAGRTSTPGSTNSGSSTPAPSTTASASSTAGIADRVTVTGCIERADQMAAATTATPAGDPDSLQYVLVRPAPEPGSPAAAPAPTGTTGTTADSRVMYRLSGDQQKLNPHVGHKVEIVGTPSTMAASNRANTPAAAAGASAPMPAGAAPGLTVESVRMIDATCAATK